jgi:hypothetical protein
MALEKRITCLFPCIMIICLTSGQMVRQPLSDVHSTLNSYSSHQTDAFSAATRPASLPRIKSFSVGLTGERRYMLEDMCLYRAVVILPVPDGSFAVNAGYFGNQQYNESNLGLSYGRSLGKINIGTQFNYYRFGIQGYGNAGSVNFEAGAILKISENLNTGVHLYNPLGSEVGKEGEERLPTVCSMGFGYDVSPVFFVAAEISKVENEPVSLNTGVQYVFGDKVFTRAGITSATTTFYFGAGYLVNGFRITVTAVHHVYLGLSSGLSVLYNAQKK